MQAARSDDDDNNGLNSNIGLILRNPLFLHPIWHVPIVSQFGKRFTAVRENNRPTIQTIYVESAASLRFPIYLVRTWDFEKYLAQYSWNACHEIARYK